MCTRQQHTPSVFYSYSEEHPTILSIGAVGETLPGRCAFQTPNNSSPKWRGCAADVHWGTLRGDFADSGEISTASVDGNTRRLAVARKPSMSAGNCTSSLLTSSRRESFLEGVFFQSRPRFTKKDTTQKRTKRGHETKKTKQKAKKHKEHQTQNSEETTNGRLHASPKCSMHRSALAKPQQ